MSFMAQLSSLFGNNSDYPAEYKRFKKAMQRNPSDQGLKAQFIKFCLLNRFTGHEVREDHIAEALKLFDSIEQSEALDLQCHYLVGKYYQENKDYRAAYRVYLGAIRRFNRSVGANPELKTENVELAYSISLNLLTLQSDPVDPEVEQCFKVIRKSFPLHLKRIEYENETAKPAPDPARVRELTEEIRMLKAEEEKAVPPPEAEKAGSPLPPPAKSKGIFSKLFSDLSPASVGLSGPGKKDASKPLFTMEDGETLDFFKLSPLSVSPDRGAAFLAYHNDQWQGPYSPAQLRSMGFLKPETWVCRQGSQQVIQAYEAPDLYSLIHQQVP